MRYVSCTGHFHMDKALVQFTPYVGADVWVGRSFAVGVSKRSLVETYSTVNTKLTIVTNVKPNVKRNVTTKRNTTTIKHGPKTEKRVVSAVLLNRTITRAANLCNLIITLLLLFMRPLKWEENGQILTTRRFLFSLGPRLLFSTTLLTVTMFFLCVLVSCLLFGPTQGLLGSHRSRVSSRLSRTDTSGRGTTTLGTRCRTGLGRVSGRTRAVLTSTERGTLGGRGHVIGRTGRRTTHVMGRTRRRTLLRGGRTVGSVGRRVVAITSLVTRGIITSSVATRVRDALISRALGRVNRSA